MAPCSLVAGYTVASTVIVSCALFTRPTTKPLYERHRRADLVSYLSDQLFVAGVAQYSHYATGRTIRGSISGKGSDSVFKSSRPALEPAVGTVVLSQGYSGRAVKLTIDLIQLTAHLEVKKRGAVLPLTVPEFVFHTSKNAIVCS